MGDGLARLALYVLIIYGVVFFIGFAIILYTSNFIFRRYKDRPLWSDPPLFVLVLFASVLGGFLAIQVLLFWNRAEERAFYAERKAFGLKMEQEYPLEIKYQPDYSYDQQFKLVFSVPVKGTYSLHVYGYLEGKSQYYFSEGGKPAIEIHEYRLPLEAGTNEFTFGFVDDRIPIRTNQSIYFAILIQPKESREQLINTQKGIAINNPGSVVMIEGINYRSPELYHNGCVNFGFPQVPCIEHDRLTIKLWK